MTVTRRGSIGMGGGPLPTTLHFCLRKTTRSSAHFLVLLASLVIMSGCSYLLDQFANPDAPVFQLTVSTDGVYDSLDWTPSSLSVSIPADTDSLGWDRSWEMLYGYYIFASGESPYDGYQLVARLINPLMIGRTWNNRLWNSASEKWRTETVGFTPADAIGYEALQHEWTSPAVAWPKRYYRVAVIALKRSVEEQRTSEGERAGDEIIYSLDDLGVSGWGTPLVPLGN